MKEELRQYYPELLGSIFIAILIIGCFLLWSVKYPSDFPGEAPIVFGLIDWMIVLILTIFVFVGTYLSSLKNKSFLSGLIMITGGSIIFLFAIVKMAYLENLFNTILYSHYTSYDINFCNENVRNWYYLIFAAFTGIILVGLWKIIRAYKFEDKKLEIGKASVLVGVVALFFSFLPSFSNGSNIWFISADSFAFWYMGFALIMGIVAIVIGRSFYREYKNKEAKDGTLGLYSIVIGTLSIIIDFLSFFILITTSIVY